jgi:hypothetical protein
MTILIWVATAIYGIITKAQYYWIALGIEFTAFCLYTYFKHKEETK